MYQPSSEVTPLGHPVSVHAKQAEYKDLFKAAETGDSSIFQSLSQQHLSKSLSLKNEDGRSLLHVAVSSSHPEMMKILSNVDEEGWAPIHSAASIGADVNVKNDSARSALHYAASKGWLKIAEPLISHSAKINSKDTAFNFSYEFVGETPLHRGARLEYSVLCELSMGKGAEVDATDKAGQTMLWYCSQSST
ncbi:26S proteasome non-ATPase regulatory subunit 10-like [Mangifera indica]|uniref:26S proteasome non-ATPase regulatory subunit 10-like n=1 Tax=Mangifera indica TaxID=29780 RepID=UPI001CFA81EB|nr:26S proteasome non-ATPase regulatory subunit 10-like [Mangifera indica]